MSKKADPKENPVKSKDKETLAISFRLGAVYRDRLKALAEAYDVSQSDMIRRLIDTLYNKKFQKPSSGSN